jgi:hypothetical protein
MNSAPASPQLVALRATDASSVANDAASVAVERRGGRPRGLPKTGGRKKGSRNRRTAEISEAMQRLSPLCVRTLKKHIKSADPLVSQSAMKIALSYAHGRPVERREIGGSGVPITAASLNVTATVNRDYAVAAYREIVGTAREAVGAE